MKLYVVLIIALVIESLGNTCVSKGMKEGGEVSLASVGDVVKAVRRTVTNPHLIVGVALLTVFFGLFLTMLSWGDISVVLPLTSIGYLFTAALAKWVLHEDVNPARWFGTLLIVAGVYFVTNSHRAAATQPSTPPTQAVQMPSDG
ncbi:MAG: DMT family transporter [Verrucomicrobiae bacterium]|nr:DMT family transporter [Verrucomicrobiae bacterium]